MKMTIVLDQLMGGREFLRYCREDYFGGIKNNIQRKLLDAAIKDEFIRPIAYSNDNKNEPLFSPFQIYIVSSLRNNLVIDGVLWEKDNVDFYKSQGQRFVSWGVGGYSFNINYAREGVSSGPNNMFDLCTDYHKILEIIHSCPLLSDYANEDVTSMRRQFTAAPRINYDFSNVSSKTLNKAGLNMQKLSSIYVEIGRFGSELDPLKNWYYYIKRHPRVRKDELRKDAALAQDMYIICELIEKMMHTLDSKQSESLFESIDRPLLGLNMLPRVEYAEGVDSKVLLHVMLLFDKWVEASSENAAMVDEFVRQKLFTFKKELSFYIEKYGDRYYQSGIRLRADESVTTIKELDEKVLAYLSQISNQAPKDVPLKQEDYVEEIANAIEWRLYDLSRQLWSILDEVGQKLQTVNNKAWDISHNTLGELRSLKKNYDLYQVAMNAKNAKDDFYAMLDVSRRIYCASCRENFVQLHTQHNDSVATYDHICDTCITNSHVTRNKGVGEWCCSNCGTLLLKFVNQNVMSEQLRSGQLLDLKLNYGRLTMTTVCKVRECQTENQISIDWGWNP